MREVKVKRHYQRVSPLSESSYALSDEPLATTAVAYCTRPSINVVNARLDI